MGSFSNAFETTLLNHIFGGTAYSQATTLYLGLATATITDTTTGATVTEPSTSGTAYARKAITNAGGWTISGNQATNAAEIAFATATGSWGTVTDWFIADNGTVGAGNILCYGTLTASKAIDSGDTAKAADNAITITLD